MSTAIFTPIISFKHIYIREGICFTLIKNNYDKVM